MPRLLEHAYPFEKLGAFVVKFVGLYLGLKKQPFNFGRVGH